MSAERFPDQQPEIKAANPYADLKLTPFTGGAVEDATIAEEMALAGKDSMDEALKTERDSAYRLGALRERQVARQELGEVDDPQVAKMIEADDAVIETEANSAMLIAALKRDQAVVEMNQAGRVYDFGAVKAADHPALHLDETTLMVRGEERAQYVRRVKELEESEAVLAAREASKNLLKKIGLRAYREKVAQLRMEVAQVQDQKR
jgi:hypothetical protein